MIRAGPSARDKEWLMFKSVVCLMGMISVCSVARAGGVDQTTGLHGRHDQRRKPVAFHAERHQQQLPGDAQRPVLGLSVPDDRGRDDGPSVT